MVASDEEGRIDMAFAAVADCNCRERIVTGVVGVHYITLCSLDQFGQAIGGTEVNCPPEWKFVAYDIWHTRNKVGKRAGGADHKVERMAGGGQIAAEVRDVPFGAAELSC